MKKYSKILLTLLAAVAAAIVLAGNVFAEDYPSTASYTGGDASGSYGTTSWNYDEETKTLTIEGTGSFFMGFDYYPTDFDIEILDVKEGVKDFGSYFSGMTSLKEVRLPSTVTSLPLNCFTGCSNLEKINIEYIVSFSPTSFLQCTSLSGDIVFSPKLTEVPVSLFSGTKITSVTVPEGCVSIGASAFSLCENLTSVKLPSTLKTIGENAFSFDTSLTEIEIPGSVKELRFALFSNCTSLKTVKLNEGLQYIGDNVFENCTSLDALVLPNTLSAISGIQTFKDCTSLSSIVIPQRTKSLGTSTFWGCTGLKTADLGRITELGANCFYECSGLESVKFSTQLTNIPTNTFVNCTSLTDVQLNDVITTINSHAFEFCSSLEKIDLPDSVTYIHENAFSYCTALKGIDLPEKVTYISDDLFKCCTSLEYVKWSDKVTFIGGSAFYKCSSLYDIKLPASLKTICEGAFLGTSSLKEITIPVGVTELATDVFLDSGLVKINLHDGIEVFRSNAFSGCKSLLSIKFPKSLHYVEHNIFFDCESLESVEFGGSLNTISERMFHGCKSLKKIVIPPEIEFVELSSFEDSPGQEIYFLGDFPLASHIDWIFDQDTVYFIGTNTTWPGELEINGTTFKKWDGNLEGVIHYHDYRMTNDSNDHWLRCDVAGCDEPVKQKSAHTFDSGVITTEPTYESEGTTTYTCSVCGYQKTESIPKLEALVLTMKAEPSGIIVFEGDSVNFEVSVSSNIPCDMSGFYMYADYDSDCFIIDESGEDLAIKGLKEGKGVLTLYLCDEDGNIILNPDGSQVKTQINITVLKEGSYYPGDVNMDGKVSSLDAVLVLRYLAGFSDPVFNIAAADYNGYGGITSLDAVLILRKIAGLDY